MKFKDIILQNLDKLSQADLIEIHSKLSQILIYVDKAIVIDNKLKTIIKENNGSILPAIRYYREIYHDSKLNDAKSYCQDIRETMIQTGELEIKY